MLNFEVREWVGKLLPTFQVRNATSGDNPVEITDWMLGNSDLPLKMERTIKTTTQKCIVGAVESSVFRATLVMAILDVLAPQTLFNLSLVSLPTCNVEPSENTSPSFPPSSHHLSVLVLYLAMLLFWFSPLFSCQHFSNRCFQQKRKKKKSSDTTGTVENASKRQIAKRKLNIGLEYET